MRARRVQMYLIYKSPACLDIHDIQRHGGSGVHSHARALHPQVCSNQEARCIKTSRLDDHKSTIGISTRGGLHRLPADDPFVRTPTLASRCSLFLVSLLTQRKRRCSFLNSFCSSGGGRTAKVIEKSLKTKDNSGQTFFHGRRLISRRPRGLPSTLKVRLGKS